jgi:predicted RNA-binding Zn-ribbon protein involved in translation (DUF1610 family)
MTTPNPDTDKRRCANCGADLTIGEGIVILVCPLCGHRFASQPEDWK